MTYFHSVHESDISHRLPSTILKDICTKYFPGNVWREKIVKDQNCKEMPPCLFLMSHLEPFIKNYLCRFISVFLSVHISEEEGATFPIINMDGDALCQGWGTLHAKRLMQCLLL